MYQVTEYYGNRAFHLRLKVSSGKHKGHAHPVSGSHDKFQTGDLTMLCLQVTEPGSVMGRLPRAAAEQTRR